MLIPKFSLPLVKYQGMNLVHQKEVEILNKLYEALISDRKSDEITSLLEDFIQDVKEHFSYEEDLMKKTRFFAYECHSEEHKRVLKELEDIKENWERTKNVEFLRRYFEEVFKPWITEHILTMDTITAEWISKTISGLPLQARG